MTTVGLKPISPYCLDLAEAFDHDLAHAADFADIMGLILVKWRKYENGYT